MKETKLSWNNFIWSGTYVILIFVNKKRPSKGLRTLHDSRSHDPGTGVTSLCAQVLQSRDWLVGPLVRIWHVESSRLVVDQIVDLGRAFAMANKYIITCACASRGTRRFARVVCGVCSHDSAWEAESHDPLSRVMCGGLNPLSTRPHQNVVWYNDSWLGFLQMLNDIPKERETYTANNEPSIFTVKCCDGS